MVSKVLRGHLHYMNTKDFDGDDEQDQLHLFHESKINILINIIETTSS